MNHDEEKEPLASADPDLLVFAFQELDNSTAALVIATKAREALWTNALMAALGEKGEKYEKVSYIHIYSRLCSDPRPSQLVSQQLVGMLIIVLVKKELRPFFSEGKTDYVSAGIGGVLVRD